ncbi:exonuclease domain-containing protein [Roseomonas sp. BN140053]|uniref:3'-5' exonuclease n=1 Tax=Roseomonas sp. BN140053 TaxID=3391898 RepID=UPI0039EC3B68
MRLPPGTEAVVFDTETTGCTAEDRVVSLGAVRLDEALDPVATLHLVFAPGRRCHPGAARVHGMSDRFLARQPAFATHAAEIAAFFAGAVACAHNLAFDRRMLGAEFGRAGLPRPWTAEYCTLRAWRRHRPGERAGLDAATAAVGLRRASALHGALEDAALAAQLLRVLHGMPTGPMRLHDPTNLR